MPTLRYSSKHAKAIGIDDCLQGLASKYGWSKVLNLKVEVYPELVIEFLSSIEVVSETGDISFYLDGVERTMTSTEVNELFGWPCDGTIGPTEFESFDGDKNGHQFFSKAFWKEVTGRDDWRVGLSKAFSFVNPAIRLWHRIMTQVLYARKDLGNLTTKDFKMLWWFVHGDKDKMGQLDFGKFLIDAFI